MTIPLDLDDVPIGDGIEPEVAKGIRLLVLDVDGVLTDTAVWIGGDGAGSPMEFKRFDIQDGLGIKLLRNAGVEVVIVSGRVSEATSIRARELGIEECHQDPGAHKLPIVRSMVESRGLEWSAVAMMGDDIPDIPVLRKVGLPLTVANGVPEVKAIATWITHRPGGHGAVREAARALLEARGEWDGVLAEYLAERSDA